MKPFLMFLALTVFGAHDPVILQNYDTTSVPGWLAGTWTCEKWGGYMTETWSAPNGNSLTGMFSHVKDSQPVFYEFMTIEKNSDGLRFYLRHFNPKSVAWEDKQSPLVFSVRIDGKHEAVFDRIDTPDTQTRLVYRLEAPDKLTVRLEKTKNGKTDVEIFNFIRAK